MIGRSDATDPNDHVFPFGYRGHTTTMLCQCMPRAIVQSEEEGNTMVTYRAIVHNPLANRFGVGHSHVNVCQGLDVPDNVLNLLTSSRCDGEKLLYADGLEYPDESRGEWRQRQ